MLNFKCVADLFNLLRIFDLNKGWHGLLGVGQTMFCED